MDDSYVYVMDALWKKPKTKTSDFDDICEDMHCLLCKNFVHRLEYVWMCNSCAEVLSFAYLNHERVRSLVLRHMLCCKVDYDS